MNKREWIVMRAGIRTRFAHFEEAYCFWRVWLGSVLLRETENGRLVRVIE